MASIGLKKLWHLNCENIRKMFLVIVDSAFDSRQRTVISPSSFPLKNAKLPSLFIMFNLIHGNLRIN